MPVPVAASILPDVAPLEHEGLANTEPTVSSIQKETHSSSPTLRNFPDNKNYLSLPDALVSVKTCLERKISSENIRDITSVKNMKECTISPKSCDPMKLCYYSQFLHLNLDKAKDKENKHPFKYTPNLWKIARELWDTTKDNGNYGNGFAYELRLKDEKLLHCAYFIFGVKKERIYVDPMRLEGYFFLDHSTVIIDKHRFFEDKRKAEHNLYIYMILTCAIPEKNMSKLPGSLLYERPK